MPAQAFLGARDFLLRHRLADLLGEAVALLLESLGRLRVSGLVAAARKRIFKKIH